MKRPGATARLAVLATAALTAVVLTAGGCGGLGIDRDDEPLGGPGLDSFHDECPWDERYAEPTPADASLPALQDEAARRLAALQLKPRWEEPEAQAFADTPADRRRLRRLLGTVLPALERYPAVLFQRLKVTHIGLVKELQVGGQRRLAMPAPERDAIVYAENGYRVCPAGMEMRTHHELYHVVEYRLFADFYFRDPTWLALNPPEVRYGAGGATAYGKAFQNLGHPQPGIVSRYALYGPEEDKAEVFAWMMTPAYAARLARWVPDDPALELKRRFMVSLFSAQTDGAMDDVYFAALPRR